MHIIEVPAGGGDSPGEQAVVHALAEALDDSYTLFRGVQLPRVAEPIDAVLVGAFGVLVVTVYEYEGAYACDGDAWSHSLDGGRSWRPGAENPVKQTLHDQGQLRAYLDRAGVRNVPVEKAVAFPNAKTRVALKNPAARLLRLKEIPAYAHQLTGQAYLTPAQVNGVVAVLERIAPVATPRPSVAPTAPARQPVPRRAGRPSLPWLIVLAVLLVCNGAVCAGFVLMWLLKNPL